MQDYARPNFQSSREVNNGLNVLHQYQWTTFYTLGKRTYIILGIDSMSYVSIGADPNAGRDYEADARAYEEAYRLEQENDRARAAASARPPPPHPLATNVFPEPNRRLFGGKSRRKTKRSKRTRRR